MFHGCFDWHSSVHGHWLLARLARLFPEAPFAADARAAGDGESANLPEATTRRLYLADRACLLAYEPSGQDFLSPCLAEADLLRRVMPPRDYAAWLGSFATYLVTGRGLP